MRRNATTGKLRSERAAIDRRPSRAPRPLPFLAAPAAAFLLLFAGSLRADTIFLKDGNQINDCKVTSETDAFVSAHTAVGDMVIPRGEVFRILKVKTAYDRYKDQLATVKEGDADGLFKLATWCRSSGDLRKESDELLAKVVSLKPNHATARRLLGHLKVGEEWIVPQPLALQLKTTGASAEDLRTDLGLFLETRGDVRLAAGPAPGPGAVDSVDACTLEATVVVTRQAGTTFYGVAAAQPTLTSTITLLARSSWIGKTPLKGLASGQVPLGGGSGNLAVQNALASSSVSLHRYFDSIVALRLKKLEEAYRKKEVERKKAHDVAKSET
jgi:hypothetical protein